MLKRGVGLFENQSPFAAYYSALGSAYHTVTISLSLRKMCWASFERSSISRNSQEGTNFPSKSSKKEMFPHNVTLFNDFTFLASFNAGRIGGGLSLLKNSPLAVKLAEPKQVKFSLFWLFNAEKKICWVFWRNKKSISGATARNILLMGSAFHMAKAH